MELVVVELVIDVMFLYAVMLCVVVRMQWCFCCYLVKCFTLNIFMWCRFNDTVKFSDDTASTDSVRGGLRHGLIELLGW